MGIYPQVRYSLAKAGVIPYVMTTLKVFARRSLGEEPAAYQVVGRVIAYQAYDGYPV